MITRNGCIISIIIIQNNKEIFYKIIGRINFHYYFFVDFLGHRDDELASEAISELEKVCPFVKCLGSYPNTST